MTYVHKVDEGIANIAVVREIDAKIEKIVTTKRRFVDNGLQHGLIDLVWDVAKHDLEM